MKFGAYLRQKREGKGWTQPIASQNVGIEQSYLSKLETGKSYPSEDTFDRLVEAFEIDTDEMSQTVFPGELEKFKDMKDVQSAILGHHHRELSLVRNWFVAGLACLMLGGASLGLVVLPDQARQQFLYRSEGIILPGEALNVFDVIQSTRNTSSNLTTKTSFGLEESELTNAKLASVVGHQEMIDRIDQIDKTLSTYKGQSFVENGSDGIRLYQMYADPEIRGISPLRWFTVPAFMFLFGSAGCFLVGFRWKQN
ncbi:MAG: helix-turn-helix domain-containing protein [Mariniblastus sp.]